MENLLRPLVTGAGGFIGYHMCKFLNELPEVESILAVDLPNSRNVEKLNQLNKVTTISSYLNYDSVDSVLSYKPTSVFALAALNGTSRFYSQPFTVIESSTMPTLSLLSKLNHKCPVVYSSSSEVYASSVSIGISSIPTKEDTAISIDNIHNPRWSYAVAKIHGEMSMVASAKQHLRPTAIVRYHNVYGREMGRDHFIPDFISRAREGVYQVQNPKATRSFLHVEDAIRGTVLALNQASLETPIFHLGSSAEMKIIEAAEKILSIMGIEFVQIEELVGPPGSVTRRVPSIEKALTVLSWEPQITFEEGVRDLLAGSI
jgi:nucleoside-diphosphate-sugar epimerase